VSNLNTNNVLTRLVRDVNNIQSALRRVTSNLPLFDISNENTPATLTADQNNYVPGNYDILRLSSSADITITGFTGGVKGRFLEILNSGVNIISFTHASVSSLPQNRILLPYQQRVSLLPTARARFYYDSTRQRWTLADPPIVQGEFGKTALVGNSVIPINAVPTNIDTLLTPDTVITDEWGYWDSANYRFTIPAGEAGLYIAACSVSWSPGLIGSGETLRQIRMMRDGTWNVGSLGVPNIMSAGATNMFVCNIVRMQAGQYVEFQARQDAGGDLNLNVHDIITPALFFCKIQ